MWITIAPFVTAEGKDVHREVKSEGSRMQNADLTMEAVITRENLMLTYQRVVENKGAVGGDNLSVAELKPWLNPNEEPAKNRAE
ncbi:hypothetical protein PS037_23420 (plasmid) [Escherichia albertii]|uniref:hypothetical protein n=1 Tax=Escherichia albertii TaxID=208962 RepID=UPI0023613C38|nr:hypothetical protein [Escherichia albertii]WDB54781.1 hypothetical protein PS037_23420 [Escherichia albertii]